MDGLIDQVPCFIFSALEDGTLTGVNEMLGARLNYAAEELLGKKMDVLLTVATRIFQQTHFTPLLKMQGHAEEIFITLRTKSGDDVPVLINAKRIETEGVVQYTYVGIEVQARKRFEEELIAARKAAEQALHDNSALAKAKAELEHHLEALDRQIGLVSKRNQELMQLNKVITHDLQEPLRKMSLFGNMMQQGSSMPVENVTERLLESLTRMRVIASGLQQYMWLDETSPKLTLVDLNGVLSDEVSRLQTEFPAANLQLECDRLSPVIADKAQMHILFYQLLSNVVQFRKPDADAKAKLVMHRQELNQYRHLEGKYKYTEYLRLELQDFGIGLDNEHAAQSFELFRRLHAQGGTGLGLALCRKIMDMHHGEISISGREGEGATVCVLIPASVEAHNKVESIVS